MRYKSVCINDKQSDSATMFILNAEYTVSKYNGSMMLNYVKVDGKFRNAHGKEYEAVRVFEKSICEKHLKIII